MSDGARRFEERRVRDIMYSIEDDIEEYGPMERSKILDEYRQDLPYAVMALDQGPFYEGDDGKVHTAGDVL